MIKPTPEAGRRYPPDGYFYDPQGFLEGPTKEPCTCISSCAARCNGECGCEACSVRSLGENHMGSYFTE